MSNITDWIKNELYPSLFESIDRALPELNFKRQGYKWISSLKLDLSKPKTPRPDKTVVSSKAPGSILENGDKAISLVDYVMSRDNVVFIDAVKTLAQVVGLQLPKGEIDQDNYTKYKERANILEDCNSYFTYCLENSPGAQDVRDYLSSRGYSDEDVKAMELGFIPSQDKLFTYLRKKNHKQELIDEIKLNRAIGEVNKLSIPYRSNGAITGFIFRTIDPGQTNKYINSTGLERSKTLFNIKPAKGDKDIVIVEGYLDALISDARGVDNVVALGGVNLSTDQIKHAINKGAKKFTLCLDKDKTGADSTLKAIDLIVAEGINRVYVATLPELPGTKTDPDSLIKERGVEALKEAIRDALPYYEYKLLTTLTKYGEIEQERELQPKDIDNLLDEVVITATNIPDVIDRDRYKTLFTSLDQIKELGITEESLAITVDRLTTTRDKENQAKELNSLLSKVKELQDKGDIAGALDLLDSQVKEVKLKDKATEFSKILLPTTEVQVKAEEAGLPGSLKTGYSIKYDELLLPAGAITVFAGSTGHGKTSMLINTTLNVADLYPDKQFIFFTYEERAGIILQYFLNTYINIELNSSSYELGNKRILRDYFKTGSTQYIAKEKLPIFEEKKREFFKNYIETGRILIRGERYSSEELDLAIRYAMKNSSNLGGVFIDYFQLLNAPGDVKKTQRINSRQEELKYICLKLNKTANDTGLPLTLSAQFNREVNNLLDMHPQKIREAADIEQIVNTLVGVWNLSKKNVSTDSNLERKIAEKTEGRTGMFLELLKSRDLATGSSDVLPFNGKTGKITNRYASDNNVFI